MNKDSKLLDYRRLIPLLAALLIFSASLAAWQVIRDNEARQIHYSTKTVLDAVRREALTDLESYILAVYRLSERWSLRGPPIKAEWDTDAKLHVRHYAGIQSLFWVDRAGVIQWIIPFESNRHLFHRNLFAESDYQTILETSRTRERPMVTGTTELPRGGTGFYAFSPIFVRSEFHGYIGAIFRHEKLLNLILANTAPRYHIIIRDEMGNTIFQKGEPATAENSRWARTTALEFRGQTWKLTVRPEKALIEENLTILAAVVLAGGSILALFFAGTVFLAQTARRRARKIESMNQLLETEIHERREAQEKLHKNERMYHQILDAIADLVLVKGPGSRIVWANKAFRDYYGMSNDELKDILDAKFNEPDYTQKYIRDDAQVFNSGQTLHIPEEPVTRHDGQVRLFETVKSAIVDERGKVQMTVGVSRDITRRKEVENVLREKDTALENAVDGIARLDPEGGFTFTNRALSELLGYKPEELAGQAWPAVIHPEDIRKATAGYEEMLARGKSAVQVRLLRRDATTFQGELIMVRIRNDQGQFTGFYAFVQDITERKHREMLELKAHFISTASHELRTPLHSIKEGIKMIQQELAGPLTAQQKEFLFLVQRNVDRLTRLIGDLLDFQKLEAGAMRYDFREADINSLIRDIRETMIAVPASRPILLDLSESLPSTRMDPDRIGRVLLNLIGNALKHGEKGPITISSRLDGGFVRIAIRDEGPGIQKDNLDRIFDAFHQIHTARRSEDLGTGLGLSISKKIVEQHGGKIWAESEFGNGTTFLFLLPAHLALKSSLPQAPAPS